MSVNPRLREYLSPLIRPKLDLRYDISVILFFMSASMLFIFHTAFLGNLSSVFDFFAHPFYLEFVDQPDNLIVTQGLGTMEHMYQIFAYSKYLIFALSIFGLLYYTYILYISKRNPIGNNIDKKIIYLYFSSFFLSILSGLVLLEAIGRFYLFFVPLMAILCSYFITNIHKNHPSVGKTLLLILSLALFGNFIFATPPALLFDGEYYIDPPVEQYFSTGRWVNIYDNSFFLQVMESHEHVIDFYAERPPYRSKVISVSDLYHQLNYSNNSPLIVGNIGNTSYIYKKYFSKPDSISLDLVENQFGKIYSNGVHCYLR